MATRQEGGKKNPNLNASNPVQYLRNAMGTEAVTKHLKSVGGRPFSTSGVEPLKLDTMTLTARRFCAPLVGQQVPKDNVTKDALLNDILIKSKTYNLDEINSVNEYFKMMDIDIMSSEDWKTFWEEQKSKMIKEALKNNDGKPLSSKEQAKILADIAEAKVDVLSAYRFQVISARYLARFEDAKKITDVKERAEYIKAIKTEQDTLQAINLQRRNIQYENLTGMDPFIDIDVNEIMARMRNEVFNGYRTSIQKFFIEAMAPQKSTPLNIDNIVNVMKVDDLVSSLALSDIDAKQKLKKEVKEQIKIFSDIIKNLLPESQHKAIVQQLKRLSEGSMFYKSTVLAKCLKEIPEDLKNKISEELKARVQKYNLECESAEIIESISAPRVSVPKLQASPSSHREEFIGRLEGLSEEQRLNPERLPMPPEKTPASESASTTPGTSVTLTEVVEEGDLDKEIENARVRGRRESQSQQASRSQDSSQARQTQQSRLPPEWKERYPQTYNLFFKAREGTKQENTSKPFPIPKLGVPREKPGLRKQRGTPPSFELKNDSQNKDSPTKKPPSKPGRGSRSDD